MSRPSQPNRYNVNAAPIPENNHAYLQAEIASETLLKSILNLYARKAMRERCSLQDAMFATLYAPAQVAAWKAAA